MARSWREKALLLTNLGGILVATYAVGLHLDPEGDHFCNMNALFNCATVNKSQWAYFLGIPVAYLGLLAFLFMFFVTILQRRVRDLLGSIFPQYGDTALLYSTVYLLVAAFMLAFQAYLTLAEVLFIGAFCLVCLGSQLVTILLAVFSWLEYRYRSVRAGKAKAAGAASRKGK